MTGRTRAGLHLRVGMLGLLLGFSLSRMGFADWGEVHRMFTLVDGRLLLTFGVAVLLIGVAYALLARQEGTATRPIRRGTLLGGALFGAGWAITGACPSAVMVQIGHGHVMALATLVGVSAGILLYQRVAAPYLRWESDSCG